MSTAEKCYFILCKSREELPNTPSFFCLKNEICEINTFKSPTDFAYTTFINGKSVMHIIWWDKQLLIYLLEYLIKYGNNEVIKKAISLIIVSNITNFSIPIEKLVSMIYEWQSNNHIVKDIRTIL